MSHITWIFCKHPGCLVRHKEGRWSNSDADRKGWFHAKDGSAYCPAHKPEWVDAWRFQKQAQKGVKRLGSARLRDVSRGLEVDDEDDDYDARAAQDT